jgi:multidrug resistance protein, MATE family
MSSPSFRAETLITLRLASPIIAGFVGQMLMGWADNIMVGRLGVGPLAACAFANTIVSVFFVFGFGVLSSVSVRASHFFGADKKAQTGEVLQAGSVFAMLLGVGLFGLLLAIMPLLSLLGQPEEVVRDSQGYLFFLGLSIIPALAMTAGKAYSEALSRPWLPFFVVLADVLLNVLLNWLFIFGPGGWPALGLTGAGLATFLARVAGWAVLAWLLHYLPTYAAYRAGRTSWGNLWAHFPTLWRLGLPSGLQVLGEVTAFAAASLAMGWIGVKALAAHQIAITCAATTFMVPLGISIALTVRVGQARGAGDFHRLRRICAGGILLAVVAMSGGAVVFLLLGRELAGLFVTDGEVIQLAAKLLLVAGIFQLFDGIQVVAVGGLRGLGDVRVPMLLTYGFYWVVALPLAAALAFWAGLEAVGVWVGLAVGLALAAAVLGERLRGKCAPEHQRMGT